MATRGGRLARLQRKGLSESEGNNMALWKRGKWYWADFASERDALQDTTQGQREENSRSRRRSPQVPGDLREGYPGGRAGERKGGTRRTVPFVAQLRPYG